MESRRLRDCLDADFHRLQEVAASADLTAQVPSCPGWTMTDLVRHVGEVYLQKVECIRLGREPDPWPPEGLDAEPPLPLLDRSYAALIRELTNRRLEDHSYTWYGPDQTVGFWLRRMAHETLIHRVDAELGTGVPIAPIPDDLAVDGIDELLVVFVEFSTANWPDYFTAILADAANRSVRIVTPQRSWTMRLTTRDVRAVQSDADKPSATIDGTPAEVLLWLWGRRPDAPITSGEATTITTLRRVLKTATQ